MTNHWIDIRNSDCIMIIGSNAAENHPISFRWVTAAMTRANNPAKLISVDPRFTRTSSKADIYAPMRSGTDIAFIGGMIRWVLNDMQQLSPAERALKYNVTYLANYTNAALIVNSGIEDTDNAGHQGLFSGFTDLSANPSPGTLGKYAKTTWNYGNATHPESDAAVVNNTWTAWTDLDEKTVLRLLWNHYSRYTPQKVSEVTGCPVAAFEEVCQTYAATGAPGKAGTIMYAMGTTQHTYGSQNIRSYAILQLLLANMGVAGGGINALRGTSNVQGSTDMCLLSHILPGYLAVPVHTDKTLADYLTRQKGGKGRVKPQGLKGDVSLSWWWNVEDAADSYTSNYAKYIISMLKAWYGNSAITPEYGFNYLPKVTSGVYGIDYTHIGTFEAMAAGIVKGAMVWGQNPAVGGPDAEGERKALEKLEWLLVTDLFETETAAFWKRPGADPSAINTEVFLLPAACSYEKQGSISNSGRWAQWRYKVIEPIGKAKPDLAIIDELVLKLKELYGADSSAPNREAIANLFWGYRDGGAEADANLVAREINGYTWDTGAPVTSFVNLKSDGSTCSGNWLYCGMFDAEGNNKAKKRDNTDTSLNGIGLYSNWSWCWPVNRRIIYNRAGVDLDGNPFDSEHPVVQASYDEVTAKWSWLGDVIDGGGDPLNKAATGKKNLPFIMNREGVGRLWGTTLAEGPVPEAYEPWESPLDENLLTGVDADVAGSPRGKPGFNDPCCYVGDLNGMNQRGNSTDFPCVGTTYRLTEHWQAGQMTRNHPWLVELQPQPIAEMGEDLANDVGVKNGDRVNVITARGSIEAVAVVTKRFQRMTVGGKQIDHVGIPWHWGFMGLSKGLSPNGSSGNCLTPHVGDANTTIPEYKTFLCRVEKA
jgi:formate dehydrogenase major subunit